jgi:DNA-binding GntR family transcriptional regulator
VEAVRESILDGRFAPGERLVEAELARQLGISRGPLREALHMLAKEGIVVIVPRRSKSVQDLDDRTIDEVYSLRKILEQYAVERVITLAGQEGVRELRLALAEMREAAESGDRQLTARQDITFHSRLYMLAKHSLLERAWQENVAGKLQILLNVTTRTHLALKEPVRRHEAIVRAVASGNVRRAQREISRHIDDAWKRARDMQKLSRPPSSSTGVKRGIRPAKPTRLGGSSRRTA